MPDSQKGRGVRQHVRLNLTPEAAAVLLRAAKVGQEVATTGQEADTAGHVAPIWTHAEQVRLRIALKALEHAVAYPVSVQMFARKNIAGGGLL